MIPAPIPMRWDGEAMLPLPHFRKAADHTYTIGQIYRLVEDHERSLATHRHYFACVREAWLNLPEYQAERFPSSEHLRKFALIKTGYANSRQFAASSRAQAISMAAFVQSMDEYSLATATESVVTVWTAQSQSVRAMGAKTFQASKQAVLDYVASLIEVAPAILEHNAARAA